MYRAIPDVHRLQAKIVEVAACLTTVADSLAASGQAAQQTINPIISGLQGQGRYHYLPLGVQKGDFYAHTALDFSSPCR